MESLLLLTGATIFGALGTIHLFYTLFTTHFEARDESASAAMKATSPRLTGETSMWLAWVGFNASHSLGAMLFAAVYIPLTLYYFELIQESLWFSVLPTLVSSAYLILAVKFWFKIPVIGISISLACFFTAAILINT